MKKILFFVLAALTFAACEQALVEEQSAIRHEAPETLTVGFEDDETRIQLNDAQKTVWTSGDLVSVFYLSNANQQWKYNGETGARTANLKRVDAGTATRDMDRVVVVYPYNADYYINPSTYNVQASLPAVQTYLEDSYGLNGNIMISQGEYNNISLKSVCGWLKLQLTGDGEKVKSITLRGNNGEQVAGELYINSADATAILASDMGNVAEDDGDNATGGAGANLSFDDVVLKEVTLDCGEGVELGAEATAFYIALPPQTFTEGLTVEITATNGLVMTKSTDNEVVIERNHIKPMKAFAADLPVPETCKIYYTATAKVEPYNKTVFGATYVSNEWDNETGKGVITFEGDVTKIGDWAFSNCTSLTSVTIPDSVTTIGSFAFYGCENLTSVTIPDSVTSIGEHALYNCDSLTSVTIPDSVTTIGEWAFYNCDSLTSVTIPDSVTTIGYAAFSDCSSLTSVTIPDSVTTIGNYAFYNCDSLKEFKGKFAADGGRCLIIDSVLNAFAIGCGVTQYIIPDSVTTIGKGAFYECSSLTSVTIPDSVTTIGYYAFGSCTSLTSVTIPDSVTTIEENAFLGCHRLKEFKGKFAADGGRCLIKDNTIIAYANASGTTYTIPDGVTTIGKDAFYNCTGLTSVTIPDSVTTIANSAFYWCYSLTSVTIPDSVTSIGNYAFSYCYSLTIVYCKPTTPPTGGWMMFDYNASERKIYVPASDDDSIINAYKAKEYWSDYADYIFEEE